MHIDQATGSPATEAVQRHVQRHVQHEIRARSVPCERSANSQVRSPSCGRRVGTWCNGSGCCSATASQCTDGALNTAGPHWRPRRALETPRSPSSCWPPGPRPRHSPGGGAVFGVHVCRSRRRRQTPRGRPRPRAPGGDGGAGPHHPGCGARPPRGAAAHGGAGLLRERGAADVRAPRGGRPGRRATGAYAAGARCGPRPRWTPSSEPRRPTGRCTAGHDQVAEHLAGLER